MRETCISSAIKKINPYIFFFLLVILLYLPSAFLRGLFYPDEARCLFIAKNMRTLADFLFPRYLGGIYYHKPPFYFWILNLLSRIPAKNYLFFPVLFNIFVSFAILSINYLFFKKEGVPEIGFLSSVLLSTTVIFYGMSILVRMDILFLLFIFLGLYFLWGFLKEGKTRQLLASALFIFLSVFTKGAFGIIFPLFLGLGMAVFFKGKDPFAKVILVNGLAVLLIVLWLFSFSFVHPSYINIMVFTQTLSRGLNPFSHARPFYYYILFLLPLFLPWTFTGLGYFSLFRRHKLSSWEKLFVLWFVGGFVILSLVRSKMPIYLLLLSVPFSGLSAKFLIQGKERYKLLLLRITAILFPVVSISACIFFSVRKEFVPSSAYIIIVLFLVPAALIFKKTFSYKFEALFITWFLFIQLMNFLYLPLASRHYVYNGIARFLEKADFNFSKIYVTDKKLLLLSVYPIDASLTYIKNVKEFSNGGDIVFISRNIKPSSFKKAAEIGDFFIFYR